MMFTSDGSVGDSDSDRKGFSSRGGICSSGTGSDPRKGDVVGRRLAVEFISVRREGGRLGA